MRLKTGMSVRVISGNHKGKEGKILRVIKDKERVIIEGVNLIKKHTRPTQENPKGGVIELQGDHTRKVNEVLSDMGFPVEDE